MSNFIKIGSYVYNITEIASFYTSEDDDYECFVEIVFKKNSGLTTHLINFNDKKSKNKVFDSLLTQVGLSVKDDEKDIPPPSYTKAVKTKK